MGASLLVYLNCLLKAMFMFVPRAPMGSQVHRAPLEEHQVRLYLRLVLVLEVLGICTRPCHLSLGRVLEVYCYLRSVHLMPMLIPH